MDTVVLACTHFPLVEAELAAAAPGVAFVDGKEGIARRTAWLTREIAWPAAPPAGAALFTRWTPDVEVYRAGFADYGLSLIHQDSRPA